MDSSCLRPRHPWTTDSSRLGAGRRAAGCDDAEPEGATSAAAAAEDRSSWSCRRSRRRFWNQTRTCARSRRRPAASTRLSSAVRSSSCRDVGVASATSNARRDVTAASTGWLKQSKLLILSDYENNTERIGGTVKWLGSRVVSVLDSDAERPGFKSQPRRCRVTVLGKLFTPIVPLFTKQQNW